MSSDPLPGVEHLGAGGARWAGPMVFGQPVADHLASRLLPRDPKRFGSRAKEGRLLLESGQFCSESQLADWMAMRSKVLESSQAPCHGKLSLGTVLSWSRRRVGHWCVLVVGVGEDEAALVRMRGKELVEGLESGNLKTRLTAGSVPEGAVVDRIVAACEGQQWEITPEVVRGWSGDQVAFWLLHVQEQSVRDADVLRKVPGSALVEGDAAWVAGLGLSERGTHALSSVVREGAWGWEEEL